MESSVRDSYKVTVENKIENIGDEIYFYPLLYEQMTENDFQAEKRKYPVDFAYPREKSVIVNYQLPGGYAVAEVPETIKMNLPANGGYFLYQVSNLNNQVSVVYKFALNKTMFLPEQYPALREFYNQIIKKHAEPVLLKKTQ